MCRKLLLSLLVSFIALNSCTLKLYDENTICVDRTEGKTYSLFDIYADSYGNKGMVVKIYETENTLTKQKTKRILVMSLDETQCQWGPCNEVFNLRPFEDSKHSQYKNSLYSNQIAVEHDLKAYPGFEWCYRKNNRSESDVPELGDWMLPGMYEMGFLAGRVEAINQRLSGMGLPALDGKYWCSDNYSTEAAILWDTVNEKAYYASKEHSYKVRAFCYIYVFK